MRTPFKVGSVLVGALMFAALLPVDQVVAGSPLVVTRLDDPVPGSCLPGDCSLREAVQAANAAAGADTVELPAATYSLSRPGEGATVGDLDVTGDLTITKTGTGTTAMIDGNGAVTHDRVFEIFSGADLALNFIGVTDGSASPEPSDPGDQFLHGGGIRVRTGAGLTMTGGTVFDNEAASTISSPPYGEGAGLSVAGIATLIRMSVKQNDLGFGFGGGIAAVGGGSVTLIDSAIVDNGGGAGFGGGVSIGPNSSVSVNGGGLYGNSSENFGGGVFLGGGSLNLINATVSGNQAAGGGAIRNRNGAVSMNNSTVYDNTAEDAGGIALKDDAGGTPTTLSMKNTILAGNHDTFAPPRPDCLNEGNSATITSNGHNLIGDTTGCTISAGPGDHIGSSGSPINPLLFDLGFNGGRSLNVLTHAVGVTSVAAGGGDGCIAIDARSVPRPAGSCDIGAYQRVLCQNVLVNRVGTGGADTSKMGVMKPTPGADGILGMGGGDTLGGGKGDDALCGGSGADTLGGGAGNDKLAGGADNEVCKGATGTDTAVQCETKLGIP